MKTDLAEVAFLLDRFGPEVEPIAVDALESGSGFLHWHAPAKVTN